MPYCTITDVQDKGVLHGTGVNAVFTATTVPTLQQVNDRIAYRASEIDSRLSVAGVSVPVDPTASPMATALLLELNATAAAADALLIAYRRSNPTGKHEDAETMLAEFEAALTRYAGDGRKKIPGDPALLRDAVMSQDAPETPTKRAPWSGSQEHYRRPRRRDWWEDL